MKILFLSFFLSMTAFSQVDPSDCPVLTDLSRFDLRSAQERYEAGELSQFWVKLAEMRLYWADYNCHAMDQGEYCLWMTENLPQLETLLVAEEATGTMEPEYSASYRRQMAENLSQCSEQN